MQIFRLILGFLSCIVIAPAGQTDAHFPQPIQVSGSSFGKGLMIRLATRSTAFPKTPSPATWK